MVVWVEMVKNGGLKIVKNGPRVWAFCKIEFPGIQKPVQIFDQKSSFFKKCGNRGVGVIWLVCGLVGFIWSVDWRVLVFGLLVGWWVLYLLWTLCGVCEQFNS